MKNSENYLRKTKKDLFTLKESWLWRIAV